MSALDSFRQIIHDIVAAFFDFEKENTRIKKTITDTAKATSEQARQKKILDTLRSIDKL